MSRLAATIEQEKDDFQRFLVGAMQWGARLGKLNGDFVTDNRQGALDIIVSTCTVLDVGLNDEGVFYQVHFGPFDTYTAEDVDPSQTLTLLLTDPLVSLPDGTFAIEILVGDGHHATPEQWLLINPKLIERTMRAVNDGKGLL